MSLQYLRNLLHDMLNTCQKKNNSITKKEKGTSARMCLVIAPASVL